VVGLRHELSAINVLNLALSMDDVAYMGSGLSKLVSLDTVSSDAASFFV
jgi:hypothetical protein